MLSDPDCFSQNVSGRLTGGKFIQYTIKSLKGLKLKLLSALPIPKKLTAPNSFEKLSPVPSLIGNVFTGLNKMCPQKCNII